MSETQAQRGIGFKGYASLALPPLFWAGNFIVARASRGELPPMGLSFGRWVIALLCLLPFAWPYMRRDRALYRQHWLRIVGLAVPGVVAFNSLVYLGLQSTTATNGMLLNSTIPLLILALGALFWGQHLGRVQIVGLVISTLGVGTIVLHGDWSRLIALEFSRGDLIIFTAMVCWAVYTLMLKSFPPEVNRLGLLAVQIAIALVFLAPMWGWELSQGRAPVWTGASVAALIYVGVVPSVLAYILYMRAVVIAGPARAGQAIHLLPLYGAVLSTIFLGEQLHMYHAVGFGAILAGILVASRA